MHGRSNPGSGLRLKEIGRLEPTPIPFSLHFETAYLVDIRKYRHQRCGKASSGAARLNKKKPT